MSLKEANQYHFFIQESVVNELVKTGGIKGITGTCSLYIFPPGTAFEPGGVEIGDKKLMEIKLRHPSAKELKISAAAKKLLEDQKRLLN